MKLLSHVVWSEGMYLSPLHFQSQTRHQEDTLGFLTSSLWSQPWGLLGIDFDTEAARNGTATLLRVSGERSFALHPMLARGLSQARLPQARVVLRPGDKSRTSHTTALAVLVFRAHDDDRQRDPPLLPTASKG